MSKSSNTGKSLSALGKRTEDPPIAWLMRIALEKPELISLAAGFTDNASLPVKETKALVSDLLSKQKQGATTLQYGPSAGDPELRSLTARRLKELDGQGNAKALSERTIITHGSQQLLYLLSEVLFDEGDIVLLEDPSYFVYFGIAQSRGIQCRGVAMDEHGMRPDALEARLAEMKKSGEIKKLKLLYLVSYFQNPSGITTTIERKRELMAVLRRYEKAAGRLLPVLEDGAYRELGFGEGSVPSMMTIDGADDRLIYTSTYSKPFATGIRAGFGVLPEWLFPVVLRVKGNHDFGTANFVQQILRESLRTGVYQRHVEKVRMRYRNKARVMTKAIEASFPDWVDWGEPDGGLYVWAGLKKNRATGMNSAFFKKALDSGVLYVPGQLCYADDPTRKKPNHQMRLSFGAASKAEIEAGISRLGGLMS